MTLTGLDSFKVLDLQGEIDADGEVVGGTANAEALALTIVGDDESNDWTYSATTEDKGTAGLLDGEAGITYNGPSGIFVRVQADGSVFTDGATMAAIDFATLAIYKNSEIQQFADEGYVSIEETTHTFNVRGIVQLDEGDVLRFGVSFLGEEDDVDVDVAVTPFSITS